MRHLSATWPTLDSTVRTHRTGACARAGHRGGFGRNRLSTVGAGPDGAASTALQALGAGYSEGYGVAAKPPRPIDHRSVVQPRFGCYPVTSASRAPPGRSGRAPHLPLDSVIPREHYCNTLEEEVPFWRDSSNGPRASPPPPGPVWRDSDELLEELRASSTRAPSAVSRR
ncbi:unnamed protein product, partial [Ectocarpus sp. 12 AP-2014]